MPDVLARPSSCGIPGATEPSGNPTDELNVRCNHHLAGNHVRHTKPKLPGNRRTSAALGSGEHRVGETRVDWRIARDHVGQLESQIRLAADVETRRLKHESHAPSLANEIEKTDSKAQVPCVHPEDRIAAHLGRIEHAKRDSRARRTWAAQAWVLRTPDRQPGRLHVLNDAVTG